MARMSKEKIADLWEQYKLGPDYSNVKRWIENSARDGSDPEGHLHWLFRSAILCATDPAFLQQAPVRQNPA